MPTRDHGHAPVFDEAVRTASEGMGDVMRKEKETNVPEVHHKLIQEAVKTILACLDLDPNSEGLERTPHRVAKFLMEFRNDHDYDKIIGTRFSSEEAHNMVAQSGIPFRMLCEHHLAPAIGLASIGYVPRKHVVGLSKLTRLVQAVGTARPSLQEYINEEVADLFVRYVEPEGVIVVIKAEHSCMACRGINTPGIVTMTSSVRGVFRNVPAAREEFFHLISGA